jgi:hypothetical protein
MARGGFFKNRRVYFLATVAYMGSLLFGAPPTSTSTISSLLTCPQVMTPV